MAECGAQVVGATCDLEAGHGTEHEGYEAANDARVAWSDPVIIEPDPNAPTDTRRHR